MNSEILNTIFIIISCLIANIIPFELVLASYAFLGPAHYLTEISWLHDRQYFTNFKMFPTLLVFLTILTMVNPKLFFLYIALTLSISFSLVFFEQLKMKLFTLFIFTGLSITISMGEHKKIYQIIGVLVPTIIHVFVFTFLFILSGYLKRKNKLDAINLILIIISISSFYLLDFQGLNPLQSWTSQNMAVFNQITDSLQQTFNLNTQGSFWFFSKVVAFAYTFHYLNWFSKTKLLGWNNISKRRLVSIIVLYLISIALYLYNYQVGLAVLSFLSIIHVVLEFPLNWISIKNMSLSRKKR